MTDFRWLIEAPGQKYLAVRKIGGSKNFHWSADHNDALCFKSEQQADMTMMAIRELAPDLFGFAVTLGDARAVEHAWMDGSDTAKRFGERLGDHLSAAADRINSAR